MADRPAKITAFLSDAGWGDAARAPLAGDASARRYERVTLGGRSAILMDDPAGNGGSIVPFVRIAEALRRSGLSAPEIYAQDAEEGLLLLEDFGDALFARIIAADRSTERPLYEAAVDVLIHIHSTPCPPFVTPYTPEKMAEYIAPAFEHYTPGDHRDSALERDITARLRSLLNTHAPDTDVMILRDYHAENLVWLEGREGIAQVGLLDFQDALAGHRAYDLVSLLEDARRDVAPEIASAMIVRYTTATGIDPERFRAACAVQATQRNLRILGIFARLARERTKPHYVDLLPRVWGHLTGDLDHPALADLKPLVLRALPAPESGFREALKSA